MASDDVIIKDKLNYGNRIDAKKLREKVEKRMKIVVDRSKKSTDINLIEKFLTALKAGLSVTDAAMVVGINKKTIYEWRKKGVKFETKITYKTLDGKEKEKIIVKDFADEMDRAKKWQEYWIKIEMMNLYKKLVEKGEYAKALYHLQWKAERLLRDEFSKKRIIETNDKSKDKDKEAKTVESEFERLFKKSKIWNVKVIKDETDKRSDTEDSKDTREDN